MNKDESSNRALKANKETASSTYNKHMKSNNEKKANSLAILDSIVKCRF